MGKCQAQKEQTASVGVSVKINIFFAPFLAWLAVSRFMLAVSKPSFSPLHSRSLISALNLHSICQFSRPFLYVCCSDLSFICSFSHPCLIYFRQSLIRAFVSSLIYSFVRSLLTPVIHSLNRSGVCPLFHHLLTGTTNEQLNE